jgi:hypothetical protein
LLSNAADDAGSDLLGLGITLHIDFVGSTFLLGLDSLANASGFASAAAPIPNDPSLVGSTFFAQGISLWPAAVCVPSAFGLSSSSGFRITIGN